MTDSSDSSVAPLLRAEVAELNGTILAGYEALDEGLDATVRVDAKRIVAAGRDRAGTGGSRKSRWHLPVPPVWAAASAGTASIAAALLVFFGGEQEPPPEQVLPPPLVSSAPVVSAPHHNVAVIQTGDPDITVFWFYKE